MRMSSKRTLLWQDQPHHGPHRRSGVVLVGAHDDIHHDIVNPSFGEAAMHGTLERETCSLRTQAAM